jgi:hypothetical protein
MKIRSEANKMKKQTLKQLADECTDEMHKSTYGKNNPVWRWRYTGLWRISNTIIYKYLKKARKIK